MQLIYLRPKALPRVTKERSIVLMTRLFHWTIIAQVFLLRLILQQSLMLIE